MNKTPLDHQTLDDLIARYSQAAKAHGVATESGDYRAGNLAADHIAAIYTELRSRGIRSQERLLPLLEDEDPGVRYWAGSHALDFAPLQGERTLESLIPVGVLIGLSAKMTLKEWRAGRLQFP